MTLRHLKIFSMVCHSNCSITKAAERLHITQPAVSQTIRELEQYYKVPLFDRMTRRLVITKAGERMLEYADSVCALFEDMEKEMHRWGSDGMIRVGSTMTIGTHFLPGYIKAFGDAYPHVKVQVFCGPANVLEQKILSNELDIALSEGVAADVLIHSTGYMDDRLACFCSAQGPFEKGQTVSAEEFRSQNLILREKGSGTRKVFDLACTKLGFEAEPMWESMSNTGVINAVEKGLGVGVLSARLVSRAAEEGRVVPFEVAGLDLNRSFYIISRKNKKMTPVVKNFLRLCSETVSEVAEND